MKVRIASLSLLVLCLAAVNAMADTIYDNGPVNGTTDAWTINFGFVVSDSFTVASGSTITGLQFAAWLFPGDTLVSAEVSITSDEFGGTTYFDGVVNFNTDGPPACQTRNQYGYNVCIETGAITPTLLSGIEGGTYWLNLQNAVVDNGDPVYWDENSGPSQASENSVGTIPSESFTILGTGTSTTGGTVPEPSSIMLFGSGVLGLAGLLRRKL